METFHNADRISWQCFLPVDESQVTSPTNVEDVLPTVSSDVKLLSFVELALTHFITGNDVLEVTYRIEADTL